MNHKISVFLIFFFLFACKSDTSKKTVSQDEINVIESEFDETKWKVNEGSNYPYRNQMLNSVIKDKNMRQLGQQDLSKLLGEPERNTDNHLYYLIDKSQIALWKVHTKYLVIKYNDDDRVEWMKIHE